MDKYLIRGGKKLSGKVCAESAKNAVLPMIAAAILTDEEVVIKNCPDISDVKNMAAIVAALGASVDFCEGDLIINSGKLSSYSVSESFGKEIRTSVLMLGALLSRTKKALISYPGGCDIGLRPIDIHIASLGMLGADIDERGDKLICSAKKLSGAKLVFPFPSVGATENVMLAASTAEGTTCIYNAAKEPEIKDLADMLVSMGAKISGAGSSVIEIEGVKKLHGTVYRPIPDRIEAGTFLVAAAVTGGEIELGNVKEENISPLIGKLCDNSCKVTVKNDIIYLHSSRARKAFDVITGPYPAFPTDMQAIATVLAAVSEGVSVIEDNVFANRFCHAHELAKMGADITLCGNKAIVRGVQGLCGAEVYAHDLRCGAALVLAGLAAKGKTIVHDIKYIERGYARFEEKLRSLGADIVKK